VCPAREAPAGRPLPLLPARDRVGRGSPDDVTSVYEDIVNYARFALAVILVLGVAPLLAQVPPPPERAPMTPALERLLARRAEVVSIASGLQFADGPFWHPEGHLLFADTPRDRVYRWHPREKLRTFRDPSSGTTAVALDREGRLLVAEQQAHRIARIEPEQTITTVVDRYEGTRLNGPHDLVVAPDGAIYFTDPVLGATSQREEQELDFQGVFRLAPDGRLTLLVRDLPRPNGIALSPDRRTLYLTDSQRAELLALPLGPDGDAAGTPRVLAAVKPWRPAMQGVPDGIAVAATGHIFVAGPGGVWVFDTNGGRLGVIATPETPSACAFGDKDRKTLFITARTRVYRVALRVAGL
jgi:gluconolactonase